VKCRDTMRVRWAFVLLILAGTTVVLAPLIGTSESKLKQREAARWLASRYFARAEVLASELLQIEPRSEFNVMLMAGLLTSTGRIEIAEPLYDQVSTEDPQLHLLAIYSKAELAFSVGRVRDAEHFLKKTLELNPRHLDASRRLAYLMRVEGRIWESEAPVRELIQQGNIRNDHLSMLGSRAVILDEPLFIHKCLTALPDDPLPRLGEATMHLLRNRDQAAESLLNEILESTPNLYAAQAGLGGLLTDQQRDAEFLTWHTALQSEADQHPQIWYVRGRFLSRKHRHTEAARCFIETLSRSPNHVEATYLLSQSLKACGKTEIALRAAQRSERLAAAETTMSTLAHGINLEDMKKAATQLAALKRYWEAAAMCHLVVEGMSSRELWAEAGLRKYLAMLESDVTFIPGSVPVKGIRREDFPLPDWSSTRAATTSEQAPTTESGISFVENASEVGLTFQYHNGSLKPKGLEHIFETTGGGVAVLDFDADRWPDLWLAQGNSVWSTEKSEEMTDAVYRNIDGDRFENVTAQSSVNETGFSQGVAVGDINSDGFSDVYVGNVGPNCLLINNGDGTFTDVTEETGVGGDEWTMSPAIVDLNQDGFPEIYSLSYLNRDEVLERRCRKNGKPLTCAPTMFTAEQDRLYQNFGDGTFKEVTQTCGIVRDAGNGLGLVAADFDHSGRISLFIGNDTTNNFFFRNESQPGGHLKFTEEALLLGLACDGLGKAQATMGIAVDDCNGDGELDLFITNFYGDPNTLFQSEAAGIWSDQTRSAQLFDSSVEKLGFGCQFLDADLDGWPDLIVTNGHVDRSDATNEPDEMRPQFYRNHSGRFEELNTDSIGQFFAEEYLGRALSTLDWNRDGRMDCCISHLFTPTALLTNTSTEAGNFLRVRLIGTTVDRDAVGTKVTIAAGGRTWTKQITMGHGYESSNERLLTFGLGDSNRVEKVQVQWTSGETSILDNLPVDAEVSVTQGGSRWAIDLVPR
jgi:tetratricopeptide (TPR) repeat protein